MQILASLQAQLLFILKLKCYNIESYYLLHETFFVIVIWRKTERMASIDKELMIKAPPEKIYNFVIKSSNLTKLWPSLVEITNEKLLPNGGYCASFKYKMAGIYLKGKSECIEVVPNKWFSVKINGAVNCTITWTFRTKDNIQTKVTITIDYHVSLPVINRLAENIIFKMNERESEVVLDNLREILEMN
jgi:hypothetical protein